MQITARPYMYVTPPVRFSAMEVSFVAAIWKIKSVDSARKAQEAESIRPPVRASASNAAKRFTHL